MSGALARARHGDGDLGARGAMTSVPFTGTRMLSLPSAAFRAARRAHRRSSAVLRSPIGEPVTLVVEFRCCAVDGLVQADDQQVVALLGLLGDDVGVGASCTMVVTSTGASTFSPSSACALICSAASLTARRRLRRFLALRLPRRPSCSAVLASSFSVLRVFLFAPSLWLRPSAPAFVIGVFLASIFAAR